MYLATAIFTFLVGIVSLFFLEVLLEREVCPEVFLFSEEVLGFGCHTCPLWILRLINVHFCLLRLEMF